MSKSIKWMAGLAAALLVAACAQEAPIEEEYVVVEPEPISAEPIYTGKYK